MAGVRSSDSDVVAALALAGVAETSAKRLSSSLVEACRRGREEVAASQRLSLQYVDVLADASVALSLETTKTVDLAGQLASRVCAINDEVAELHKVAEDVERAIAAVAELEAMLSHLEAES